MASLGAFLVLAGLVSWWGALVEAAVDDASYHIDSLSMVVGSTPTAYRLKARSTSDTFTSGVTYEFTFNQALFTASAVLTSASGECTEEGTGMTVTCTVDSTGMVISMLGGSGGTVAAGSHADFIISSGIEAFPSPAAAITLSQVTHSVDATAWTTGITSLRSIYDPTITLTSGDMYVGTTPSQLEIQFIAPGDIDVSYASPDITITANRQVFVPGQASGFAVTGATLSSIATTNYDIQLEFSANLNRGASYTFTLTAPILAALPNSLGAVKLKLTTPGVSTLDYAPDITDWDEGGHGFGSIEAIPSPPPPAMVGGDPVTWIGNKRAEFKLPMKRLTTMVSMPDLTVAAAPFLGATNEQWIGRVVVTSKTSGNMVLQVDIKRNLLDTAENLTSARDPRKMETMDVIFPLACKRGLPPYDSQFRHPEGFVFVLGKWDCKVKRGTPCRETVLLLGKNAKIVIASSSAVEWYGEDSANALKHAHLDLEVFDMTATDSFEGVLPELWGFKPMSSDTLAMLVDGEKPVVDVSAPAVAGNASDTVVSSVCAHGKDNLTAAS